MYKKIFLFLYFFAFYVFAPAFASAETHITNGYLYEGGYWSKSGSPYILEDYVTVPTWQKLTIGPGVTVISASSTPDNPDPFSLSVDGELEIRGTAEDPVRIDGLGSLFLGNSTTTIDYAYLVGTGLDMNKSRVTLSSSTLSGALAAITARRSTISISGSEIRDNTRGIASNLWTQGPVLSIADQNAIGGIGNGSDLDQDQNIIEIHSSILTNNQVYSINNKTANTIDATDNWWGSSDGPASGAVLGPVDISPWKIDDPHIKVATCCSNVLFLPGLEASRLYLSSRGLFGTTTNTLWEPNRNADVRKLYLNPDGTSINPTIYTSDILGSAFGLKDIYKSFIAMMDGVVADKKINQWLPFAYDWRMNVPDIVTGLTSYSTSTKSLIREVEGLAHSSKTGKVSVIAHSNGGLVAKTLGKELEKKGELGLIDKVIFVGVPQLGTPQAVASILHGDSMSILGGLILSSGVARTLGENMLGAYGLLPSEEYFRRAVDPVITFGSTTLGSYSSFTDFLTGKIDPRVKPKESDTKTPTLLSKTLLSKSQELHTSIDTWHFPDTIQSLFISGWGTDTVKGIKYLKDSFSFSKTVRGDGTVLADSAKGLPGETVYLNQGLLKHDSKKTIEHPDILEAQPVKTLISEALTSNSALLADISLPPYISRQEPRVDDYPWMGSLVVSVHSPVDLDVYDNRGGHIGLVPLKDKVPGHNDSDLMIVDDTIGGKYEQIGDDKYITLPTDTGATYSAQLKGTGTGTFTFQVQKFDGYMNEIASSTYADLPVTPLLIASSTFTSLATSPDLNLDIDGNGKVDIKIKPNIKSDPLVNLEAMRQVILSLKLRPALEKLLLVKIEAIKLLIKKDKKGKIIARIRKLGEKVGKEHWRAKGMTEDQKKIIADMFDSLLDSLSKE